MQTTLYLIRHGQTDWNAAGRWQGHADIPLNENGRLQAQKLAERIKAWSIDAFLSSDLKRAAETAQIIAAPHAQTPTSDPIWRERDIGAFQGMTGRQARQAYPDVWQQAENGKLDIPQAETFAAMQHRAKQAYDQTVASHQGQTVAIVSHGQFIHVLLAWVMRIDPTQYGRFSMRVNTGLSIIEVGYNGPVVTRLNDGSHLE